MSPPYNASLGIGIGPSLKGSSVPVHMAYARFSRHSDVYVYLDVRGHLRCERCTLEGAEVTTTAGMLAHLERHRARGDRVPDECLNELEADAEENDAWMAEEASRR